MGRIAAALTLATALAVAGSAAAVELSFDKAFAVRGEPAQLHYVVLFQSRGGPHRMEVWRDGDRRIKRVTDGLVETYAAHKPGDAELRLTVVDRKKKIVTRIDRTDLYRIGDFTDWFDLGHGLRHPKGRYELVTEPAPGNVPRPPEPCAWYRLTQGPRASGVCWSTAARLPLIIVSAEGRAVWRVTALDRGPIAPRTFRIDDRGLVHVDADRDITAD